MPTRSLAVAAVLLLGTLAARAAAPDAATDATWDKAAAARYLDARMDTWWAKAKPLKTGDGETKCLSCHTAVPYALARPSLRIAMGQAAPTAHEERMLDTVRQRVANVATEQPYYDHTEAKKVGVARRRSRAERRRAHPVRHAGAIGDGQRRHPGGDGAPLGSAAARRRVGLAELRPRAV